MKRDHIELKNHLRQYREEAGLSQAELAKMVGSSRITISSIETGRFCPTAYLAALICGVLEKKFEEIFYLEEV